MIFASPIQERRALVARFWRFGLVYDHGSLLDGDGMLALRRIERKIAGRQIIRADDWTGSEFGAGWRLVWL